MVRKLPTDTTPAIIYPDFDSQPMADNTKQFRLIVVIKENLELLFATNSDVFVAGDLLWYPVEGDNKTRSSPDVIVAFGMDISLKNSRAKSRPFSLRIM